MRSAVSYCLVMGVVLLQGCAQYMSQPVRISKARLGAESPQYKELISLPVPKEKVIAAVYKFRDQTGQYKDTDVGASWSTAVTQGATSILLRAMEESGWFIPIEREGLSNLLNERKIIRSSIANYNEKDDSQQLPPLVFAGIIMEGGIISFDSNIMTGGVGARYFGAGASTEYREDRVTIYLRAVSTSNGRILKTVYTSKTILSQQVDVGVFRFVSTGRLLEAETGFTFNEPGEMAVKEAIEKAVFSLVVEGITDQLWMTKNETDAQSEIVKNYIAEKNQNKEIDAFGNRMTARRSAIGVGVRGSALWYEGDVNSSQGMSGWDLSTEFRANRPVSIGLSAGMWNMGTGDEFKVTLGYMDVGLKYKFFHELRTTPYLRAGLGLATEFSNTLDPGVSAFSTSYTHASAEFGLEFLVTQKLGINVSGNYHVFFSDNLDRMKQGSYNDSMWGANIGLMFYLF